jgi:hypothetical protein
VIIGSHKHNQQVNNDTSALEVVVIEVVDYCYCYYFYYFHYYYYYYYYICSSLFVYIETSSACLLWVGERCCIPTFFYLFPMFLRLFLLVVLFIQVSVRFILECSGILLQNVLAMLENQSCGKERSRTFWNQSCGVCSFVCLFLFFIDSYFKSSFEYQIHNKMLLDFNIEFNCTNWPKRLIEKWIVSIVFSFLSVSFVWLWIALFSFLVVQMLYV